MKNATATVCFLLMIAIISSCTNRESSAPIEQAKNVRENDVSGETCQEQEPPKTFIWNEKTYKLKFIGARELEPGMKIGYLACDNGIFTQQAEGINATFNIYTYGSPLESSDLLYFGKWGRALYTAEEKSAVENGEHK